MKDFGPLKVLDKLKGIFYLRKYTRFKKLVYMATYQPIDTFIENQVSVDKRRYKSLVGSLIYVAHTRAA